ncbi:MAG: hypothetical protein ACXWXL_15765 [Candidatus Binatia bacterium]
MLKFFNQPGFHGRSKGCQGPHRASTKDISARAAILRRLALMLDADHDF